MKTLMPFSVMCFCVTAFAQNPLKFLDINQVKAGVYNRGDMHWNMNTGNASYEVPVGSGAHSDFATGLWIGGIDAGNIKEVFRASRDLPSLPFLLIFIVSIKLESKN